MGLGWLATWLAIWWGPGPGPKLVVPDEARWTDVRVTKRHLAARRLEGTEAERAADARREAAVFCVLGSGGMGTREGARCVALVGAVLDTGGKLGRDAFPLVRWRGDAIELRWWATAEPDWFTFDEAAAMDIAEPVALPPLDLVRARKNR